MQWNRITVTNAEPRGSGKNLPLPSCQLPDEVRRIPKERQKCALSAQQDGIDLVQGIFKVHVSPGGWIVVDHDGPCRRLERIDVRATREVSKAKTLNSVFKRLRELVN